MMHRARPGVRRAAMIVCSLVTAGCSSSTRADGGYPHAAEPIGTLRQSYDGELSESLAVYTFRNIDRLFPTRTIPRSAHPLPLPGADTPLGDLSFTDRGVRYTLDDYLGRNRVSGLLILQDGRIRFERYRLGNSPRTRRVSTSGAKSITSTLVRPAPKPGAIASRAGAVTKYVP